MNRNVRLLSVAFVLLAVASLSITALGATVLKVAVFKGGYGVQWVQKAATLLEQRHPGLKVEITADPRIWEKVQPMFVAGNPPDVVAPGWGFDYWGAIVGGQVKPLDDYLHTNAIDKNVPWIDTFAKGTFSVATYNGHIWYMPLLVVTYGGWYNKTIWDQHGWVPPKSWDEAFKLFDSMKAAGVAPIANQGKYAEYLSYQYLPEFIARLAGPGRLEACFNLRPNSWTDPKVVEAVAFIKKLSDNYFEKGNLGMSHLESQAEVMVGKAGVISCGSWFPSEEAQVWPENDEIRAMPLPPFSNSPYPQNVYSKDYDSAVLWIIPAASKHADLAAEFLKILTSEQVAKYTVEVTGNVTTYKGSEQWIPDNKFGRAVKSSTTYYKDPAYLIFRRMTLDVWYPKLITAFRNNFDLLLEDKATPAEFCAAVQAVANKMRNDPTVLKHYFTVVYPSQK